VTSYQNVLVEVSDRIGTLTLNRADKLNAFAGTMRQEMAHAMRALAEDDGVRVIVVTGAGRAFCAGADIGYMKELTASGDVAAFRALVEAGREVVTVVREAPKPVIASVNGPAAGGGANFALSCDLRIASDRATIGQTFNRIGLHPDWGGTFFLPRLVGAAKALELIYSAEMIAADEALRLGLFSRVVPHDQLAAVTREVALELAAKPPMALALAKKAVHASDRNTLDAQLDMELTHQLACFQSEDAREGLAAFLAKRPPQFRGH
jgi:2-(1,2-epoxy-1,2-dihydrophenyl)acetyl-CoA isomerase